MKAKNLKIGDKILVDSGETICYHKVCQIEETSGLFGEKQLKVTSKPLKIHSTTQIFNLDEEIICAGND